MGYLTQGFGVARRVCSGSLVPLLAMATMSLGVAAACDKGTVFQGDNDDLQLYNSMLAPTAGHGEAAFVLPLANDYSSIPQDPRNPITAEKVALGRMLFHETGLLISPKQSQGRETASCASCHHVAAGFQAGRIQGVGEGGMGFGSAGEGRFNDPSYQLAELDVQPIRSPSALNVAYQDLMLWNGQFGGDPFGPNAGTQSSWTVGTPKITNILGYMGPETQAIAGLAVHRLAPIEGGLCDTNPVYESMFKAAFPTGGPYRPDFELREQAGLAIAAYERTLLASQAPFQRWLRGERGAMTAQQKRGGALFFGKAQCVNCHTGPALNSMTFHALGMPDLPEDHGGVYGTVRDKGEVKGRGGFTGRDEDMFKFKVPQLYNLKDSPFLGHGGTFGSVREVIVYKNNAVKAAAHVPDSQLSPWFRPLGLTEAEIDDLTAFVEDGLRDPGLHRYVPESLPSGLVFPNNDPLSRTQLSGS